MNHAYAGSAQGAGAGAGAGMLDMDRSLPPLTNGVGGGAGGLMQGVQYSHEHR